MRYGLISIAAAIALTFAFSSARPQATAQPQASPQPQVHSFGPVCPPGQSSIAEREPDGSLNWGCSSRFGGGPVGEPPLAGMVQSCAKDSDCPGDTICQDGRCGRTNMQCDADADCKYSEFCDTSKRPVGGSRGICSPRGGHY